MNKSRAEKKLLATLEASQRKAMENWTQAIALASEWVKLAGFIEEMKEEVKKLGEGKS